jgi:hypothetical protein
MKDNQQKVLLIDISLFILDIIDFNKVYESESEYKILEVPGALATMLWSAKAGSLLLYDFIYAHLSLMQHDLFTKQSHFAIEYTNENLQFLLHATPLELHDKAKVILERIQFILSPLIDGAIFEGEEESYFDEMRPPQKSRIIKRYEPVENITAYDLNFLRKEYSTRYNLPIHPLLDMYFLQIYHAQTIGLAASPVLKRDFITIGKEKIDILAHQIGMKPIEWGMLSETRKRHVIALVLCQSCFDG